MAPDVASPASVIFTAPPYALFSKDSASSNRERWVQHEPSSGPCPCRSCAIEIGRCYAGQGAGRITSGIVGSPRMLPRYLSITYSSIDVGSTRTYLLNVPGPQMPRPHVSPLSTSVFTAVTDTEVSVSLVAAK